MFGRLYTYQLKMLAGQKWIIGWNFLFPLVLATAFFLGFGNLISDDPDSMSTIDIGIVSTTSADSPFISIIDELSKETDGDVKLLNATTYTSKEEAIKAMNKGTISGFYLVSDIGIETIVPFNGYDATILNEIVREYENKKAVLEDIMRDHPENMESAVQMISQDLNIIEEHDFGCNTSPYIQYFYSLLAMASLFGSWISTAMLEVICADKSEHGKRFECSPSGKLTAILAGMLAGLTFQSLSNIVTVLYIEYVLGINLGAPLLNIALITTLGSAVGIASGVLIGALCNNERLRVSLPIIYSMVCSFLSGLMWLQIKQIIESNCPIVNRLNPAALLTDSLYVLATYGKIHEYYLDIATMLIIIVICLIISTISLRRRKYASL